MKSDLSRNTDDRTKHYRDVLKQQGRVDVDADWNEQQAINMRRIETEATDVIGACGAPLHDAGFHIVTDSSQLSQSEQVLPQNAKPSTVGAGDFLISAGRYYVDGILCENEQIALYSTEQPDLLSPPDVRKLLADAKTTTGIVYLDVWQRLITAIDDPLIREKALGGPDTSNRAKIVWQVKVLPITAASFDTKPLKLILKELSVTLQIVIIDALPAVAAQLGDVDTNVEAILHPVGVVSADETLRIAKSILSSLKKVELPQPVLAQIGPQINSIISRLTNVLANADSLTCDSQPAEWTSLIEGSNGTLKARTQPSDPTERPCLLPPSAGYQRLENQLYRVEIHQVNEDGTPTFVWSRDNGTVVTAIKSLSGNNVVVANIGPDDVLGFANGQWVEIIDDEMELNGAPGQLLQIDDNPDEATRTITLKQSVPAVDMKSHPKLRRWDQTGDLATQDGVPVTFGWQPLEDGIEVRFSRNDAQGTPLIYKTGDYWLIPARTATGEIEWPPFEVPNTNPSAQPPAGIRHHYCRLALAQIVGETIKIQDCRKIFPPLTELNIEKCCAVSLSPDEDWRSVLNNLKTPSAHVCFQIGDYTTDEPILLTGFQSLKITGSGPGTRIQALKSEAAFIFRGCQSVEVSDLYGETGKTGFGKKSELENLRGVLTFYDCGSVTIDSVVLKGADWIRSPGATRGASCICVEPDPDPGTSERIATTAVRIRHCDLTVGSFQVGILVADSVRTQIEDNVIAANQTAIKFDFGKLLENREIRANVRRLLVSRPTLLATPKGTKATPKATPKDVSKDPAAPLSAGRRTSRTLSQATFVSGKTTLIFDTPPALKDVLPVLLAAKQVKRGLAESLPVRLNRIADRVLLDPKFRRADPALVTWFNGVVKELASAPMPASQGIVVAGRSASEVRIRDNTVIGAAQGIHVGLSHGGSSRKNSATKNARARFDLAESVSITGNSVHVNASALLRAHEGIFVGNCDNLVIEANRLFVTQIRRQLNGIRVFGWLPSLVIIRHNRLTGFGELPILFRPLGPPGQVPKLLIPPLPQLLLENLTD